MQNLLAYALKNIMLLNTSYLSPFIRFISVSQWGWLFQDPAGRRLVLWLLISLFSLQSLVFIPLILRYEQQQLMMYKQLAANFVTVANQATEQVSTHDELLTHLQNLQFSPRIKGGALYDKQATLVGAFGDKPVSYQELIASQSWRSPDGKWLDVAWSMRKNYTLVVRVDVQEINDIRWQMVFESFSLAIISSFVLTGIIFLLLQFEIFEPLMRLRQQFQIYHMDIKSFQPTVNPVEPFNTTHKLFSNNLTKLNKHTHELEHLNFLMNEMIEQLKQQQYAQKTLQNLLQQRTDELQILTNTLSTDFKKPLKAIIGYSDFTLELLRKADTQNVQELLKPTSNYLRKILRAGRRAEEIIDTLLLLVGFSKQKITLKSLDMNLVIQQAVQRLQAQLSEYNVNLHIAQQFPRILGYAPWLEEVWFNYLSNAIQYGGNPPVVEIGYEVQDKHTVRFWIRDNGNGLSSEMQQRLFSQFDRQSTHGVYVAGQGLGLAIVQHVIYSLGGQVGVESEIGAGSLFYFTLPLAAE